MPHIHSQFRVIGAGVRDRGGSPSGQIVERRNDVRRLSANISNLLNTSADIRVQVTDRIVSCGDAPIGDQSDNAPLSHIGLHKGVEDTDLARRTCRYLRAIDTATKISAC